ncbi:hypothetical protein L9F63_004480, partial [Diploptera punctata]
MLKHFLQLISFQGRVPPTSILQLWFFFFKITSVGDPILLIIGLILFPGLIIIWLPLSDFVYTTFLLFISLSVFKFSLQTGFLFVFFILFKISSHFFLMIIFSSVTNPSIEFSMSTMLKFAFHSSPPLTGVLMDPSAPYMKCISATLRY